MTGWFGHFRVIDSPRCGFSQMNEEYIFLNPAIEPNEPHWDKLFVYKLCKRRAWPLNSSGPEFLPLFKVVIKLNKHLPQELTPSGETGAQAPGRPLATLECFKQKYVTKGTFQKWCLLQPEPKRVSAFLFRARGAAWTGPVQVEFSLGCLIFCFHLPLLLILSSPRDLYSFLLK